MQDGWARQRIAMPSKKRDLSVWEDAPSDDGIKTQIVDDDRNVVSAESPGLWVNRPRAGLCELHFWPGNHRLCPKRGGFERFLRTRPLGLLPGFVSFQPLDKFAELRVGLW